MLLKLVRDVKGVTSIEYAFVAGLISVAALAGYGTLASKVQAQFGGIEAKVSQHM